MDWEPEKLLKSSSSNPLQCVLFLSPVLSLRSHESARLMSEIACFFTGKEPSATETELVISKQCKGQKTPRDQLTDIYFVLFIQDGRRSHAVYIILGSSLDGHDVGRFAWSCRRRLSQAKPQFRRRNAAANRPTGSQAGGAWCRWWVVFTLHAYGLLPDY